MIRKSHLLGNKNHRKNKLNDIQKIASLLIVIAGCSSPVYFDQHRYTALDPNIIELPSEDTYDGGGGVIAADVDSIGAMDLVVTGPGYVAAVSSSGTPLWRIDADIQITEQAETEGLPGLHAPGVQVADIDGTGHPHLLFLTKDGFLAIIEGSSGDTVARIALPSPPAAAERWEHLVVSNLRREGDRDLVLQATNASGYRMGRFIAGYAIDTLLKDGPFAEALWQRNDFIANAHNGLRVADLDHDGRTEILGGDIIGPDGDRLFRLPLEGHLDSIYVADVRPDLPGLEVVGLEEGGPERVFLYNHHGLIWQSHHRNQEPQNAIVGDFVPDSPGLETWCRSRYNHDQQPWMFDAFGEVIGQYEMASVAPPGWTSKGVEIISTIRWNGDGSALAAAKERHEAGDVAIFDPLSGSFVMRLEEEAERLYVVDVSGDWREEIIVVSGGQLRIYENPAFNSNRARPRFWTSDHYRRSKMTWNYYST